MQAFHFSFGKQIKVGKVTQKGNPHDESLMLIRYMQKKIDRKKKANSGHFTEN